MIAASAYILRVPPARRAVLLDEDEQYGSGPPAEPVDRFKHSRRAPLIVLAEFQGGKITHIAKGRKGVSGGRGLVRLNLESLHSLENPITFRKLVASVPKRFRSTLRSRLENGGLLPPKTVSVVVEALLKHDPTLADILARFSRQRAENLARLSPRERSNLALQKETLGAALEIAGFDKEEILAWSPSQSKPRTFLEGLSHSYVREGGMLTADFDGIPGFSAIAGATHYAAKTFENDAANPPVRLTVVMANRQPLEAQTGADLIYFNETFKAFVMVQYKAMDHRGEDGAEFRWQDGDQLAEEIARMDAMLAELEKVAPDDDPDGYRLNRDPFFLKFCSRLVFNPRARNSASFSCDKS